MALEQDKSEIPAAPWLAEWLHIAALAMPLAVNRFSERDAKIADLIAQGWHLYPLLLKIPTPTCTTAAQIKTLMQPLERAFNWAYTITPDLLQEVRFFGHADIDGVKLIIPFITKASVTLGQEGDAQQAVFNMISFATSRMKDLHFPLDLPDLPVSGFDKLPVLN